MVDSADKDLWARLEPVLDEALELEGDARAAYLDRACAGDEQLRQEVERMLAAGERSGPLDRALPDLASTLAETAGASLTEPRSRRIGAWELRETIGSGGMGRVYRAERVEGGFEQTCALKILRWDMASASLVQRFATERQILADLDHPGIARLIDGGVTDEGLPYLAMEYVEGRPIDEVAAALPLRERLQLFLEVCDAVQHAHRRLVVHRDLKPSNILVTGDGEVKLLDFGVAKILDESGRAHDATQTRLALATPLYAAPEQLALGRVTTATDVWALGVLLHRLLCGTTPFRGDEGKITSLVREILERDPLPPSAVAPREEKGRLRGDLDTIVLKALAKEPERRYGSVEGLANDVRRHLEGEPIAARPATVGYRARKFARRHRRGLAVATGLVVALAALVGFYTDRLARERDRAQQEARTTEQVKSFVLSLFETNDPGVSRGEEITARELLDRGAARIPEELAGQPLIEAEMHAVVAGLYHELGTYDRADHHFARAAELWRAERGEDAPELADALSRWGFTLQELGDYEGAERRLREALSLQRSRPEERAGFAAMANQLGMFLSYKGEYEEAEALLREAVDTYAEVLGPDSPRRATAVSNLGLTVKWAGRMDEAEPYYREALRIRRAALGSDHPDVAVTLDNLGVLLGQRGDYEESEASFREALAIRRRVLGETHPDVALNLNNLATLFRVQGRLDEAEPIYREVLALNRAALGADHPRVATNLVNLGSVAFSRGELDVAVEHFEEALRIRRTTLGDDHVEVANALEHLVRARVGAGRLESALRASTEAVRVSRVAVGEEGFQHAAALAAHADVLRRLGRAAEARDAARRALALQEEHLAPDHWELAASRGLVGACLLDLGRLSEAELLLEESHTALREARGPDDWATARSRRALMTLYERTGRPERARALEASTVEGSER